MEQPFVVECFLSTAAAADIVSPPASTAVHVDKVAREELAGGQKRTFESVVSCVRHFGPVSLPMYVSKRVDYSLCCPRSRCINACISVRRSVRTDWNISLTIPRVHSYNSVGITHDSNVQMHPRENTLESPTAVQSLHLRINRGYKVEEGPHLVVTADFY